VANNGRKNEKKCAWVDWNTDKMEGTFITYPSRDQIPEQINEQLIVELYSK
jgi:small subunit ribosomal protein S4